MWYVETRDAQIHKKIQFSSFFYISFIQQSEWFFQLAFSYGKPMNLKNSEFSYLILNERSMMSILLMMVINSEN